MKLATRRFLRRRTELRRSGFVILFLLLSGIYFNTPPIIAQSQNQASRNFEIRLKIELADSLIKSAQYNAALAQLDPVLNNNRNQQWVWFYKGQAHAGLDEKKTAVKCFERAIRINQKMPQFHLELGKCQLALTQFEDAIKTFTQTLALTDSIKNTALKAETHFWLGRLFDTKTDTSQAAEHFRQALVLIPEYPVAREFMDKYTASRLLVLADRSYRQGSLSEASTMYRQALILNPQNSEVAFKFQKIQRIIQTQTLIDSAMTYKRNGDWNDASRFLQQALTLAPDRKAEIDNLLQNLEVEQIIEVQAQQAERRSVSKAPAEIAGEPFLHDGQKSPREGRPAQALGSISSEVKWFGLVSLLLILTLSLIFVIKSKDAGKNSDKTATSREFLHSESLPDLPRYRIKKELGRGSMGRVYSAYDRKLERQVALKFIRFDTISDEDEIAERISRFRREAKATAALNHPGIVSLYDYNEVEGAFYMTMELVEGQSIQQLLAESGRLPIGRAVEIATKAFVALECAHRHNVIHRDIKPSNIMLNRDGQVKILDFGLAKVANISQRDSHTKTGIRIGSPLYMAPEQINSEIVDARTDIFSMGVVFYEILTGIAPFKINQEEGLSRLFYQILNYNPPKPSSIRSDIPVELDPIMAKLLAKQPEKRFQETGEIVARLKSLKQTS